MSPDDFRRSIDFIADQVLPRLGVGDRHFLTVEYLGGEVLLVPPEELRLNVAYARARFRPLVRGMRDGAQSNLIGSKRKILELNDLFYGNLGTSWDNHSDQRHIGGSPELYRRLLDHSLAALERDRNKKPGRVLVIDAATAPHIEQEVHDAIREGYDLVLRPVFQGGSDGVDAISPSRMAELMEQGYRIWSNSPQVRVEPFYSLFMRRLGRGQIDPSGTPVADRAAGCPFQADCAFKSLSLDPDGTLHICQEMADAGHFPLGNALRREFDERTWRRLARRTAHLSSDCAACEWRSECGGGCMNEAIEMHGDPFAKTEFCPAWKTIFRLIEADIASGQSRRIEQEIR